MPAGTIEYQEKDGLMYPVMKEETVEAEYGTYGRARRKYLEENRPEKFLEMMVEGTLEQHCRETDTLAEAQEQEIMRKISEREGLDEAYKDSDPVAWARKMAAAKEAARETVMAQIIRT